MNPNVFGNENVGLKTLSVSVVRSIAAQHGGSIDVDTAKGCIKIRVPSKERDICAQEISSQLEAMRNNLQQRMMIFVAKKILFLSSKN